MLRVLALAAIGVALAAVLPTVLRSTPAPRRTDASCPYELTKRHFECFTISLPESRSRPDGRQIRLAAAVARTTEAGGAGTPVVYLTGGPGAPMLDGGVPPFLDGVRARHDVVVLDPRGTGRSTPSLDCPELFPIQLDALELVEASAAWKALIGDALVKCRARLVSEGVDLDAYASADQAADVNDLRRALGYDRVALIGASYGTRLALTVARDFPDAVRSIVLDSTVPLDRDFFLSDVDGLAGALDEAFAACGTDTRCAEAYPDLATRWRETAQRLHGHPEVVEVEQAGAEGTVRVAIDHRLFVRLTRQLISSPESIGSFPAITESFGSERSLERMARAIVEDQELLDLWSTGANLSALCREAYPFVHLGDLAAVRRQAQEDLGVDYTPEVELENCRRWDVEPADPREGRPVASDVPALILAGRFDAITPPATGKHAAETLPHSEFLFVENEGHVVLWSRSGCVPRIVAEFLDDPSVAPDSMCLYDLSTTINWRTDS